LRIDHRSIRCLMNVGTDRALRPITRLGNVSISLFSHRADERVDRLDKFHQLILGSFSWMLQT
jgi:hypothetical protein